MHRCTLGSRDLLVGDVADERMPEDVLVFSGDGGSELASNELFALEGMQPLRDRPTLAAESTEPEDTPDDRGLLEKALLLGWERVDPGGNHPLHGLGNDGLCGTLDEHAGELLRVQRIPTRALEEPFPHVGSIAASPSRALTSDDVSSSDSGVRRIVDELTFPPPQPGRRVRSSGRRCRVRAAARSASGRRGNRRSRA